MNFNRHAALVLLLGFAAAEVIVRLLEVPAYFVPAPSAVARELVRRAPLLLPNLFITLAEALAGFVMGNVCAFLFGVLFSRFDLMRQSLYPLLVGFQAVPLLAVAPFINIWFGTGMLGKALMAAVLCYFPATVIIADGLASVNRNALLLLQSMGASQRTIFWVLRLPSAIPSALSSLQVSSTLCTVGAVVAEISGSDRGIGYIIVRASYEFRTTLLFAALAIISIATFLLFKLVQVFGRHFSRRYRFSYV